MAAGASLDSSVELDQLGESVELGLDGKAARLVEPTGRTVAIAVTYERRDGSEVASGDKRRKNRRACQSLASMPGVASGWLDLRNAVDPVEQQRRERCDFARRCDGDYIEARLVNRACTQGTVRVGTETVARESRLEANAPSADLVGAKLTDRVAARNFNVRYRRWLEFAGERRESSRTPMKPALDEHFDQTGIGDPAPNP